MSSRRQARAGDYIETDSGNKVWRKAALLKTPNIILGGRTVIQPDVMIRGDLVRTLPSSSQNPKDPAAAASSTAAGSGAASGNTSSTAVAIGRYCYLSRGCILKPPGRLHKETYTYMPLRMGDHVFVGQNSIVQAAVVGSHVYIGQDVTVGELAIIKDYVRILDGTVIPPNMVIASFSVVGGAPARLLGEVPEGEIASFDLRDLYKTAGNHPVPLPV